MAPSTGGEAGESLLLERKSLAVVLRLEDVDNLSVDAETGGGVGSLAEQTGRETGVESAETLVLDDTSGDGDGTAGGAELEAHLDDVHGLDDARGTHTGETTVQERLHSLPGGVISERHGVCF